MSEEKESQKSVLNGWISFIGAIAALITGIATLFTALGVSNVFPDLVKRLISGESSTYTPTPISTPSKSSNTDTW